MWIVDAGCVNNKVHLINIAFHLAESVAVVGGVCVLLCFCCCYCHGCCYCCDGSCCVDAQHTAVVGNLDSVRVDARVERGFVLDQLLSRGDVQTGQLSHGVAS